MRGSLQLTNVWRVVRDVDLQAIREAAYARFDVWVVGDDEALARECAALISPGDSATVHPWIATPAPHDAVPGPVLPALVALVSRHADLPAALERVRAAMEAKDVPLVTLVVGARDDTANVPRRGESARAAVPALDSAATTHIAGLVRAALPQELRIAAARQLPALRLALMNAVIEDTARANASYAFTTGLAETIPVLTAPLNVGDMIILTKNQLLMSYRIALMAGRDAAPRKLLGEIVGVLGGGLLFRQAARQLVGLVPGLGLLPKIAIAYGGTFAIGRAMLLWATEGRAVTGDAVRIYAREGLARGREVARSVLAQRR